VRLDDGTMKVLIEIYRRVTIRRFVGESDGYLADIADLSEGPIPEAPELIQRALARFKDYAAARDLTLPRSWASLEADERSRTGGRHHLHACGGATAGEAGAIGNARSGGCGWKRSTR